MRILSGRLLTNPYKVRIVKNSALSGHVEKRCRDSVNL